jgi:hypothetical protein
MADPKTILVLQNSRSAVANMVSIDNVVAASAAIESSRKETQRYAKDRQACVTVPRTSSKDDQWPSRDGTPDIKVCPWSFGGSPPARGALPYWRQLGRTTSPAQGSSHGNVSKYAIRRYTPQQKPAATHIPPTNEFLWEIELFTEDR